ncbi:DUF2892 domain-containing protein [Halobacteriales archaeon SW_7_68_16]|nr:MAG: DUF2892 domain-containing protein [Halobacteriales archaeon SW_7_68_16]
MERNVGRTDRIVRGTVGIALVAVGVGVVLGDLGTVVAVTAFAGAGGLLVNAVTGRCLANRLLGIDTCDRPVEDAS